jgi:hypothetical protein
VLRRRARHRHDHRARLGAALALAALAGCGGDDEPDDFSPVVVEPLSKVEFLDEADRICFASEARIEAAADDLVTRRRDPAPAEVERVALGVVVPALESEVRAIRALGAPDGDEQEVEEILSATEQGIAAIERDPRGLLDGVPAPLGRAQRLAEAYGSRQCGFRATG